MVKIPTLNTFKNNNIRIYRVSNNVDVIILEMCLSFKC